MTLTDKLDNDTTGGRVAPEVRQVGEALPQKQYHALTIDVEDYFQVEAFAKTVQRADWDAFPRRVEQNTERLLDILAETGVAATFFTLGWVAARHPNLVRRIVAEGHELASHGSDHHRADQQLPEEFRADVQRCKRLLEDITGRKVRGYRAPTFSIGYDTVWAHSILAEEGYQYSSSVYPVAHDFYGVPAAPRRPFHPTPDLLEIPLTTVRFLGKNFPASGGGYFRLLPYRATRSVLRRATRELATACVFYLHPWEIDPDQPRQRSAPLRSRVRHYVNLRHTEGRLKRLLQDFCWTRMDHIFLQPEQQAPFIPSWLTYATR